MAKKFFITLLILLGIDIICTAIILNCEYFPEINAGIMQGIVTDNDPATKLAFACDLMIPGIIVMMVFYFIRERFKQRRKQY
jgi:hypothetical protein